MYKNYPSKRVIFHSYTYIKTPPASSAGGVSCENLRFLAGVKSLTATAEARDSGLRGIYELALIPVLKLKNLYGANY